ncbi:ion transporter [Pseudomonas matsuisoli]|uniref:Potassium channel n=1 Tax=Pseudomonas matsuisoli TaxID=1515666 RepID=A0A917PJ72_9PSED|nr:ion transporter [Pseudomonas matsuisoli]GGJ80136.1 potassium channel [Pseudomonas matsuisoli]
MDAEPRSNSVRARINTIIFHVSTPAGRAFDISLLVVILASLLVVMLDSIDTVHAAYGDWLAGLEWVFTTLFAIEYLLRVYSSERPKDYVFSFYGLIDVIAILPAFIALFYPDAQYLLIVRVIRMLRVFRVLKLVPYLSQANFLLVALRASRQKIVVFLLGITTLVTVYGTLMYVIEGPPNGFTSIPKSIYWAIVTLTTVGFGDMVPKTALGQTLASLVMITGYAIIAVPTGIFTAELANAMRPEALHRECPRCEKGQHEQNASYCNRCGAALFPAPDTGASKHSESR